MPALVSVIIPTYNRAHLIGETLDSIIAQTYKNWECIVVDDGSTDYTGELLKLYCERDSRIHYHHRPKARPKGANACRNYGFENSRGDYIFFFDSDDLMLRHKIELHLYYMIGGNYKLCISKSDNFTGKRVFHEKAYDKNFNYVLNIKNYLFMNIFWITINVSFSRLLLEKIKFNEDLKSGQEYNFFAKIFAGGNGKLVYINEVLSLHRLHQNSIQGQQKSDTIQYLTNKYLLFYKTYIDIENIEEKRIKLLMIKNCQSFAYRLVLNGTIPPNLWNLFKILLTEIGLIKTSTFIQSIVFGIIFKKGYRLLKNSYPAIN